MKHRIKAAAALLGVHPNTVKNYIESGKIAAEKDSSGYWSIDEAEIQRFLGQWSDASEEEVARMIGKQYIVDQIEAKIADKQQIFREHLRRVKSERLGDQMDNLYSVLAEIKFLHEAMSLVESIEIPSSAIIEWTADEEGDDN